ncbi:MAG TPA: hypothetical protein VEC37_17690 [Bacillota bacterium]|nr:hypothetical protein [Bacillota bacterium]
MRKQQLIPLLLLLSLALICIPSLGASKTKLLTGRISVVGHWPFIKTVIHTSEPKSYLVAGPLQPELDNLRGATVQVKGIPTFTEAFYKLTVLEVQEYEILNVTKGGKPWVGILKSDGDICLELTDKKRLVLDGTLTADLLKQTGAKVWVTGKMGRKGLFKKVLQVDAFGVIRPVKQVTK